jgi:PAS domain S-box-containing protein
MPWLLRADARGVTHVRGALRRPPALVLVGAAVLAAAWLALPGGAAGAVVLLSLNACAVAALVVGVRRHRPAAAGAWHVLLGTQVTSFGTFVSWYLYPSLTGVVLPVPSPSDALFLLLYAGNCLAVALLVRREQSGRDRETLLDVLVVSVSLAALSWVFLMAPYARAADLDLGVKLVSVAYPALDLVLLVLVLRLAVSGSRTTPARALLLAWAGFQLAGDTTYSVLALAGRWTLDSPVQLLWMGAFACLAAAALHPSMGELAQRAAEPDEVSARGTSGQARKAVLVGAVGILPLVLTIQLVQGHLEDLLVIAAASLLVFLLALARFSALGSLHAGDRRALTKLVASFVVFALLPLGLLAESSIRLSERAAASDARAAVRTTSLVSAELVRQQLEGLGQLVESYAERQLLLAALGDGSAASFDRAAIDRHLMQISAITTGVAGVFLTDAEGRVSDVLPATPGLVGKQFRFRDWYQGAPSTRGHYVSEAYRTAISGEVRVVAVAVALRDPRTDRVLGILAIAYDLEAVQSFSERLALAQGVGLTITDQRGVVVAAPGAVGNDLVSIATEAGVAAALRGRDGMSTGQVAGQEVLSASAPVPDLGWTVTARLPTKMAYASLGPLRSTVLGIAVLLGQVLLGGLVLMARGQRQRRAAERSLEEREVRTRGILDAAADAFVSVNADGVVTSWSTQSELLFGWTAEQATGTPLAGLIAPAEGQQTLSDAVQKLRVADSGVLGQPDKGQLGQRVELLAAHRDGREFAVEMVVWQSVVGGVVAYNAFLHEITDRKRHEEQLASARDEALEASRMKTEFLAVMSHELRTPLNGVMGMTSLLLASPLSRQQRDYAQTVRTSADALLGLLNDVLDLSKVEADRLELEELEFDLHQTVRDVVHLLVVGAREKGVAFEADIDPGVPLALSGDPARLRQVLLNLMDNALKFTEAGSVHLRVSMADVPPSEACPDEVLLRFDVADTGIGIPPGARDRLFLSFSQVDASTTRRYGGTGLGLAISKSLVTLFGGEISVESEVGRGSTFSFTARFRRGTAVGLRAVPEVPLPRPRTRCSGLVLVVDDNATNQKVAVRMLETLGHRADVAADGREAVEACARVPYDLVLMDCRMPGMDGYDATGVIRAAEGPGRRTPIVAMTASAMLADRQRCLEVGMDDYLSKPVRLDEVADKVEQWLYGRPVLPPGAPVAQDGPPAVAQDAGSPAAAPASSSPGGGVLDDRVVAGLRHLGADFLARLVPVFVLAAPDRLTAIRTAFDAGDSETLADAAHALRGSAGNLGGLRVAELCAQIEQDPGGARSSLDQLEVELPRMLDAMLALVDRPA